MMDRRRVVKTLEFRSAKIIFGDTMMIALKVTQVGDEMALVLSDEALELLGVSEGDTLCFEASPDGGLRLAKLDMSFDARRERDRAFLNRYRKTFETLAK